MANEKAAFASSEEVAALAARLTAIEQTLAEKIPGFEGVGARVSELSSAFQQANTRLSALEALVRNMTDQPATGEAALREINSRLSNLSDRLAVVEQTRARGGRLSQRLALIESRLPEEVNENG